MKAFLTIVFAVGLVAAGLPVMAEEAPRLLWGSSRQLGVGSVLEENASFDPNANTSATGQALSSLDTLRGSGSPVGYVLRHGNVIAKTLTVSVNGRQLVRNKDFFYRSC